MSDPNSSQLELCRPLGEPWRVLEPDRPEHGYASYYYSDELGAWPVRAITKLKDNKSDPNLETGTYGLFSTCEEKMRSGIVTNRPRYLFFITRSRRGPRQLTGYYELGYYTPGALRRRTRDFALAAVSMRFIEPIPLVSLPDDLPAVLGGRWRLNKRLTAEQSARVAAVIDHRADRTAEYLAEVKRLEDINEFHSGFRYPSWRRTSSFSWGEAEPYLEEAPDDPDAPKLSNQSATGWWKCASCQELVENTALLKACPHCHRLGVLRPATTTDLEGVS